MIKLVEKLIWTILRPVTEQASLVIMASRRPTQSLSTQEIVEELDILSEGNVSDL